MSADASTPEPTAIVIAKRAWSTLRYALHAFSLVWAESHKLTLTLLGLSLTTGALPGVIAYLAKLIIDGIAKALQQPSAALRRHVFVLLGLELATVVLLLALQRLLAVCDALLRVRLSQGTLERVLRQALGLSLPELETPAVQDDLRLLIEHAPERPLALVRRALIAVQQAATLLGVLLLLAGLSPWLLLLLLAAVAPALWVELRLNADAFKLYRSQSLEARKQNYLASLMTRDVYAKELRAYGVGELLLARHRAIFERSYRLDRRLSLRRAIWGFGVSLLSAGALSASYVYATWTTLEGHTTIGGLAMLFVLLRQAQASSSDLVVVAAGMHEDQLYLASLDAFLSRAPSSEPPGASRGSLPGAGIRLENVSFTYPGASRPALENISLHLPPGVRVTLTGPNGSGKSTLVKLMLGLYQPSVGRITLDGLPLQDWDRVALRKRLGVVFQDFGRYQLLAGENVGIGAAGALDSPERWESAARDALAEPLLRSLPQGAHTQLGTTFEGGRELSTGEWQRLALSRIFAEPEADIVILDEPSASLDAAFEAELLRHLDARLAGKTALLISHRARWTQPGSLSLVLQAGRLVSS